MKGIRRHLGALLIGASVLAGCGQDVPVPIDKGEIDGKNFTVYSVNTTFLHTYYSTSRTIVEISGKAGTIEKVLGEDGSGKIGDGPSDFVEIRFADGKKVQYTIDRYTNEDGQEISYSSDIGRILGKVTEEKLKENDVLYQRIKQITEQNIKRKL